MPNPSSPQQSIRAHVFIAGRVQGVGYRYFTMDEAVRLGVNGLGAECPGWPCGSGF
jgi:acylphosphatase